jgi:Fe2+ transport system protein FeoA
MLTLLLVNTNNAEDYLFMQSLYEVDKCRKIAIKSVPDISLLNNLGIHAGTLVTVQNRYAFGGPVVLRVEEAYTVAIGKDVAKQVMVAAV